MPLEVSRWFNLRSWTNRYAWITVTFEIRKIQPRYQTLLVNTWDYITWYYCQVTWYKRYITHHARVEPLIFKIWKKLPDTATVASVCFDLWLLAIIESILCLIQLAWWSVAHWWIFSNMVHVTWFRRYSFGGKKVISSLIFHWGEN